MDEANAPEKFYANVDTKLVMTKNATYTCVTLLSDALLIFRTYVVWGRKRWIVVLPVCIYLTDFGEWAFDYEI